MNDKGRRRVGGAFSLDGLCVVISFCAMGGICDASRRVKIFAFSCLHCRVVSGVVLDGGGRGVN